MVFLLGGLVISFMIFFAGGGILLRRRRHARFVGEVTPIRTEKNQLVTLNSENRIELHDSSDSEISIPASLSQSAIPSPAAETAPMPTVAGDISILVSAVNEEKGPDSGVRVEAVSDDVEVETLVELQGTLP